MPLTRINRSSNTAQARQYSEMSFGGDAPIHDEWNITLNNRSHANIYATDTAIQNSTPIQKNDPIKVESMCVLGAVFFCWIWIARDCIHEYISSVRGYMTKTRHKQIYTNSVSVDRFYRKTVIHSKLYGEYFAISDDSEFGHTTLVVNLLCTMCSKYQNSRCYCFVVVPGQSSCWDPQRKFQWINTVSFLHYRCRKMYTGDYVKKFYLTEKIGHES